MGDTALCERRCWVLLEELLPCPQLPGQLLHLQTPARALFLLRQAGFLSIFLMYFSFALYFCFLYVFLFRAVGEVENSLPSRGTSEGVSVGLRLVLFCCIFPIPFLLVKSYFFRLATLVPDLSMFPQQQQWFFCSIECFSWGSG